MHHPINKGHLLCFTPNYLLKSFRSHIIQTLFLIAYMRDVLTFQFSDDGSNLLPAEKQAYINFVDFLDECEGWLDYYTEIIIALNSLQMKI